MSKSEIVELSHLEEHRNHFVQKMPVTKTIIRKKKRAVSFERRFLSARGSGDCKLEIAVIWHNSVMSVKQYNADNDARITIGAGRDCDYHFDTNPSINNKITIAHCANNQWQLLFNNANEGFVLRGDEKIEFKSASNHEFAVPALKEMLQPGSLACPIDGNVRAKYTFGDVSILVRYVNVTPFAAPFVIQWQNYGPLAASLLIHLALFSVILFATSRVDALIVDRIMTTSRFAVEVAQPVEEPTVETPDEVPPDENPQEAIVQNEVFAPNSNSHSADSGSGQVMTKAAAAKMASGSGLLNQATAMNSLLAAGPTSEDLDNLDLFNFDASVAAANNSYGLNMTGTQGGMPGVSSIPGGPGGISSKAGSRLIQTGRTIDRPILPDKDEAKVKPGGKIDVSGSLDRLTVQKVVRQHFGELRACYEREAIKIKGLSGRVVVVWIIAANGSVTKALVKETTMKNKTVENCVINSVEHWRFPALKGGGMAKIEYPFDFIMSK